MTFQFQMLGKFGTTSSVTWNVTQSLKDYSLVISSKVKWIIRGALARRERWQATDRVTDCPAWRREIGFLKNREFCFGGRRNHYAAHPPLRDTKIGSVNSPGRSKVIPVP